MNWKVIKTYYVVILNILTGLLISVAPLIVQTPTAGTSLVFGISIVFDTNLINFLKKLGNNIENFI